MAEWAQKFIDANDERHADEAAEMPTATDAKRSIDFAVALGQFAFVLPAQVQQGRAATAKPSA